MKTLTFAVILFALPMSAQDNAAAAPDPWKTLSFLEGTWDAKTKANGAVTVAGSYSFRRELDGHIMARHASNSACKGPDTFDCNHGDLLYLFRDAPGQPVKAIYFDNEGHVIHYDVSTPSPNTALFLSDAAQPGPRFRLVYERKQSTMDGKFQMQMPGQAEWKSYLEWSGPRQPTPPLPLR